MIRDKVRATLPDGSTRYYDGLVKNPDGSYRGIEIKSNSASLTRSQKLFDDQLNLVHTPASATLDGKQILIKSVDLRNIRT